MQVKVLIIIIISFFMLTACDANVQGEIYPSRITSSQAQQMMAYNENVMILDVRSPQEFAEGHIEGAVLLPANEIEALAPVLILDKDMALLIYCRSGSRSYHAARTLVELGYTAVYDFGGILDWEGPVIALP